MTVNIAVVYYSATGNVYALAEAMADGAQSEGAQVRLRRVAELAAASAIAADPALDRPPSAGFDVRPRGQPRRPALGARAGLRHPGPVRQHRLSAQAVPRHLRRPVGGGPTSRQDLHRLRQRPVSTRRPGVHPAGPLQLGLPHGRDPRAARIHRRRRVRRGRQPLRNQPPERTRRPAAPAGNAAGGPLPRRTSGPAHRPPAVVHNTSHDVVGERFILRIGRRDPRTGKSSATDGAQTDAGGPPRSPRWCDAPHWRMSSSPSPAGRWSTDGHP